MSERNIEARSATTLLDFDGEILEIFSNDGSKTHARELSYRSTEPDKKGR